MSLTTLKRCVLVVGAVVALYHLYQAAKKEAKGVKPAADPPDVWVVMAADPKSEVESARNTLLRRLNALMEA